MAHQRLTSSATTQRSVGSQLEGGGTAHSASELPSAPGIAPGASAAERILVRRGDVRIVVRTADVEWIEAADNDVRLHVRGMSHQTRGRLALLLSRLEGQGFVRVHRSAGVNLAKVNEVHPWFRGGVLLVMQSGTRVPVSLRYRPTLFERLGVHSE